MTRPASLAFTLPRQTVLAICLAASSPTCRPPATIKNPYDRFPELQEQRDEYVFNKTGRRPQPPGRAVRPSWSIHYS